MRVYLGSVAALCVASGGAYAGAIDRSGQSVDVLFENGRYIEFSLGAVSPDLTGESVSVLPSGSGSGDISPSYITFGAAYKADLNDRWSYALILDEPYGAQVDYAPGTGYFAQGSDAEYESRALTGLLQYNMENGFSVYGGLRVQSAEARANVIFGPLGLDYSADADAHYGIGYVAGLAYERPEIALRVSLTYSSEISHSVDTVETQAGFGTLVTSTEFETPQSVNLNFQTGIAANTLLFGGVRWVDWSDFRLDPALYEILTSGALLSYQEDVVTYTLGVGRKLNDNWSVAASLGYEENTGNFFTNLGPADGQESIGLAVVYTDGPMKITTGLRYVRVGDTVTRAGPFAPAAAFNGNDAVAIGVKVGYSF